MHPRFPMRCNGAKQGGFGFTPEPPFHSNDASPPHFREIAAGRLLRPFDGETIATQPD
jgi:hypothetical protein